MENNSKRTVAIIGAGPGGLISGREALQCGLTPTIFEKRAHVGGLWHPETGGTWDTMRTNLTKYSCCFSDYLWSESAPTYLSQTDINKYLCDYFDHCGLRDYTHFNTNVDHVVKSPSGDTWTVTFTHDKVTKSQDFDFVIVACGVFSNPYYPPLPGKELFKGQILHSGDYKRLDCVKGENVVVVGGAFSGAEIAVALCEGGKKTTNVISNPVWILDRWLKDGSREGKPKIPLDMLFYTRVKAEASKKVTPEQAAKGRNAALNNWSNQGEVCEDLKIEVDTYPRKLTITDNYLENIKAGKLKIKTGEIASMDENGLVMKDGSHVVADSIIFSTGFTLQLPFFDSQIKESLSYKEEDQFQPVLLHKCTFHPELRNMGFVGIYRGPYFSILELQARWITMAFSKGGDLYPTREEMAKGIEEEKKIRDMSPRPQFPHGDYVNFADWFAKKIGALPDLGKMEKEDPELYRMMWNNMVISSHYRLEGFGSNKDMAREEIERLDRFLKKCSEEAEEKGEKV